MKKVLFLLISVFSISLLGCACDAGKTTKDGKHLQCETHHNCSYDSDESTTFFEDDLDSLILNYECVSKENTLLKKELSYYKDGKTPSYIITFKLKQSRLSLDLEKHAKDALNAITFNMSVSEEFYKSVNIGTNVVNNFRTGSFIVNGDFGKWKMRVINKQIV